MSSLEVKVASPAEPWDSLLLVLRLADWTPIVISKNLNIILVSSFLSPFVTSWSVMEDTVKEARVHTGLLALT